MTSVATLSLIFVLFIVISSYRIVVGPSPYDRLLGLNVVSVLISVIFITFSMETEMGFLLDIALVFIVLNFVATLGFAKYLERGEFR